MSFNRSEPDRDGDPRSRRALLGTGAAAMLAVVAHALGRPARTVAGGNDPILMNQANVAKSPTDLDAGAADDHGFAVTHALERGTAIKGAGSGASSAGVLGTSPFAGVRGVSDRHGVEGRTSKDGGVGVHGASTTGANGIGVEGTANAGTGVRGQTSDGVGVRAEVVFGSGTALDVIGKARFSRSGRVTIGANQRSVVVSMAGISSASYVVATLQKRIASDLYVVAAVPTLGKVTIHLNRVTPLALPIGFLVIN